MSKQDQTPATSKPPVAVKPYQTVDESTGDYVDAFRYLPGHPRQYRFDGKAGCFNINGNTVIGKSFTFQPIAWRIFTDDILGMGRKTWAELFFIDDKNCVSAILFHGYSVDNLFRQIEPLFYDGLTLADVVLTVTADKKQSKVENGGTYYMAQFDYKPADKIATAMYKAFTTDREIYRAETLTDRAQIKTEYGYFNPFAHAIDEPAAPLLATGEGEQALLGNG